MKVESMRDLFDGLERTYKEHCKYVKNGANTWEIPREYSKASIQRKILILREELLALSKQLDEG